MHTSIQGLDGAPGQPGLPGPKGAPVSCTPKYTPIIAIMINIIIFTYTCSINFRVILALLVRLVLRDNLEHQLSSQLM